MSRAAALVTPPELVLGLYAACREAEAGIERGDHRAAEVAARAIEAFVAEPVRTGRMEGAAPTLSGRWDRRARRTLAHRPVALRLVDNGDLVVAFGDATVDVFRVAHGRVVGVWCLDTAPPRP